MIKYIKPYEITEEQEKLLKRINNAEVKEQKENPQKIYWYMERMIKGESE